MDSWGGGSRVFLAAEPAAEPAFFRCCGGEGITLGYRERWVRVLFDDVDQQVGEEVGRKGRAVR